MQSSQNELTVSTTTKTENSTADHATPLPKRSVLQRWKSRELEQTIEHTHVPQMQKLGEDQSMPKQRVREMVDHFNREAEALLAAKPLLHRTPRRLSRKDIFQNGNMNSFAKQNQNMKSELSLKNSESYKEIVQLYSDQTIMASTSSKKEIQQLSSDVKMISFTESNSDLSALASSGVIENAYQSTTTIAKTENGVRIVIDIYFDDGNGTDVAGSRLETAVPQSRILTEFQQTASTTAVSPKKEEWTKQVLY